MRTKAKKVNKKDERNLREYQRDEKKVRKTSAILIEMKDEEGRKRWGKRKERAGKEKERKPRETGNVTKETFF